MFAIVEKRNDTSIKALQATTIVLENNKYIDFKDMKNKKEKQFLNFKLFIKLFPFHLFTTLQGLIKR